MYVSLSGGRLTLVDLLGNVGVSGNVVCSPTESGKVDVIAGLLGGVTKVGDSGERGFIMSPVLCDEVELGFIMSPAVGDDDIIEPGFIVSPALIGGLVGV